MDAAKPTRTASSVRAAGGLIVLIATAIVVGTLWWTDPPGDRLALYLGCGFAGAAGIAALRKSLVGAITSAVFAFAPPVLMFVLLGQNEKHEDMSWFAFLFGVIAAVAALVVALTGSIVCIVGAARRER